MSSNTDIYVYYYKWLVKNGQIKEFYEEYLKHVLEHKKRVLISWIYICDTLCELDFIDKSDVDDISKLIMKHDESKFRLDEFVAYARRFNGPRQKNEKVRINFKEAVKLHKERNLHHYEALKAYKGDDWKCYVVELVCDYIAMGWELDNYILEYYDKVKDEINLPPEYKSYLETILSILREDSLSAVEKPITNEFISEMLYKDTILIEKKYTFHNNQGQGSDC